MLKDLASLEILMVARNLIKQISENRFQILKNIREVSLVNIEVEFVDENADSLELGEVSLKTQ